MHFWTAAYDPKTRGHKHTVSAGFGHALLASVASAVFQDLGLAASIWEHGQEWLPIHGDRNQQLFEFEHGKEVERGFYNAACLERVQREQRTVHGEFMGYCDVFVPILRDSTLVAVLVVGSLLREPPSAAAIFERWRALTGREVHPSDPEFNAFVASTLSVCVMNPEQIQSLERLLECLASLMSGQGRADELMNQIEAARAVLDGVRVVDRTWELMREILDDFSKRHPQTGPRGDLLRDLGLTRAIDHVLVGLLVDRGATPEPVDELVRRHSFQRRATELAHASGHAVGGRVGDHGIVFLSGSGGSPANQKRKVRALGERAFAAAERCGLTLHIGISSAPRLLPVAQSYRAALAAAESAVAGREKVEVAKPAPRAPVQSLPSLRRELGAMVGERPELLAARFERYLQAVAVECTYRVEPARIHLEVGFERMVEALLGHGVLDEKGSRGLLDELARTTREARTISELFAAYRRAALEISKAARAPAPAHRDRSLRNAIEHIQQHYAESLSRDHVARIAGFSPGHFSELFKQREGKSFEQYVAGLRIERAKQLLDGTDLDARRVAELSGYKSSDYFTHAFRRATGVTPLEYRRHVRGVPRAPGSPGRISD